MDRLLPTSLSLKATEMANYCHAVILIKLNDISQQQSNIAQGYSIGYGNLLLGDEEEEDYEGDDEGDGTSYTTITRKGVVGYGSSLKDKLEVRKMLIDSYFNRLVSDHYDGCIWKNTSNKLDFELVKNQYYLKMSQFDELVSEFDVRLDVLNKFQVDVLGGSVKFKEPNFEKLADGRSGLKLSFNDVVSVLNQYGDFKNHILQQQVQKYNQTIMLIGLLGWCLKRQKFGDKYLLLLRCDKCGRRILLGETHQQSANLNNEGVEELSSCQYPPATRSSLITRRTTTANNSGFGLGNGFGSTFSSGMSATRQQQLTGPAKPASSSYDQGVFAFDFEDEEEDQDEIDLIDEHQDWCCLVNSQNHRQNQIHNSSQQEEKENQNGSGNQIQPEDGHASNLILLDLDFHPMDLDFHPMDQVQVQLVMGLTKKVMLS
ncbi:unnamed protein product [Ambrosiozyma monospora]|uniref:Unnamed protein product n=1 Tax=Ambrosiozyma monospora TaxID=43982 RepID=A0ACB5TK85_AMBMO|nr:unnamed protein product [Ambrosiozyma monospora]